MAVINTNLLSIVTTHKLNLSKNGLASAIERLASGLRINSAKDDAAGQGIANRLTANIRGFAQAKRNVSDGISIAQTAEGALSQSNNNLHRIRELTVQAKNGSNSQEDLNTIQSEIRLRLDEMDRIAEQTQFNGKKVLNGNDPLTLQTGVNDNETVTINTRAMKTDELGIHFFNVNGLDGFELINQEQADELTNQSGLLPNQLKVSDSSAENALSTFAQNYGLTADSIGSDKKIYQGSDGNFYMKINISQPVQPENAAKLKALRVPTDAPPETVLLAKVDKGDYQGNGEFNVEKFDIQSVVQGQLSSDLTSNAPNNGLNIIQDDVSNQYFTRSELLSLFPKLNTVQVSTLTEPIKLSFTFSVPPGSPGFAVSDEITYEMLRFAPDVGVKQIDEKFYLNFVAKDPASALGFFVGQNVYWDITDRLAGIGQFARMSGPNSTLYINLADLYLTGSYDQLYIDVDDAIFSGSLVSTSAKTMMPLESLDKAMTKIDDFRGELGAVMNRLESTMQNISTSKINLEAARSRIEDADYALEVSNMSRNQILQQAGMSVLSQANQSPELVLQLLR